MITETEIRKDLQPAGKFASRYYVAAAVSLLTFLVYLASLWNGFVLWDDNTYVSENPHIQSLDQDFFRWAFLDYYSGNWHPLTWISHALDYAVWGLNPIGHHLTNNILHAVNTFLVVLLVVRLIEAVNVSQFMSYDSRLSTHDSRFKLITAGVTGLLFGLHPIHVESVAWVSERKDLLCAMFYLLSVMAYLKYTDRITPPSPSLTKEGVPERAGALAKRGWRSRGRYIFALFFFILALMCKPMAVTLPVVLLLLDWFPLARIRSLKTAVKVFAEKIPFAVLSLGSSLITLSAQKSAGALSMTFMFVMPLPNRLALAGKSLLLYLWKMIVPVDLMPLYLYPLDISPSSPEYLVPCLLVAGITIVCVVSLSKQKLWAAVWIYFVITLLPVLGIVQVGLQSMADRYAYIPSIGPFLLAGLLAAWVWEKAFSAKTYGPHIRKAAATAGVLMLVSMSFLTFHQIGIWRDSISLWTHVIETEPGKVAIAYGNRGVSFIKTGDLDKALEDFTMAVKIDPFYAGIFYERGMLFLKIRQFDRAVADFDQAIILDQAGMKSDVGREFYHLNRGVAYFEKDQLALAVADFKQACELGSNKGCENLELLK